MMFCVHPQEKKAMCSIALNAFDHQTQDQQCVHCLVVPLLWIYK